MSKQSWRRVFHFTGISGVSRKHDDGTIKQLFCVFEARAVAILVCLLVGIPGCASPSFFDTANQNSDAIESVLLQDAQLGHERNIASMTGTVARAASAYAKELEELDYRGVPDEFKVALLTHAAAWQRFSETVDSYPHVDTFRMEMHDALDMMQAVDEAAARGIQLRLEAIWATWGDVETIAKRYGVIVE